MKSILPLDNSTVVSKEESKRTTTLSPESILQLLFTYRDIAHKFHLNCFVKGVGSYAEHKALNKLYNGIQDLQDDILEQMMGYLQKPINPPNTSIGCPPYKSTDDSLRLCEAIIGFADELQSFAKSNSMSNIENLSQELSGLAAHTRYFLMFK